uniref:Uncharacterized protein n=1 Tax=Helianthus annuus TaxID=4232 RepID=A0A251TX52_HELAN
MLNQMDELYNKNNCTGLVIRREFRFHTTYKLLNIIKCFIDTSIDSIFILNAIEDVVFRDRRTSLSILHSCIQFRFTFSISPYIAPPQPFTQTRYDRFFSLLYSAFVGFRLVVQSSEHW